MICYSRIGNPQSGWTLRSYTSPNTPWYRKPSLIPKRAVTTFKIHIMCSRPLSLADQKMSESQTPAIWDPEPSTKAAGGPRPFLDNAQKAPLGTSASSLPFAPCFPRISPLCWQSVKSGYTSCGGIKLAIRTSLLSCDKVPSALIAADSWDQTNIYRNTRILIKQGYYPVKMMNTNLYRKSTRCKVGL